MKTNESPENLLTIKNVRNNVLLNSKKGKDAEMTIIIGLLCKDGVVLASDSQAVSWRGVDIKRLDYQKIASFKCDDNLNVVVSGAGTVALISKAIEKLHIRCQETKISTPEQLAEAAEDVMTDMEKRYIVDKFEKLGVTKKLKSPLAETGSQIEDTPRLRGFIIVVGCADSSGGNPCIYIIGPDGVAQRVHKFDSVGSGSVYAEYLLAKYYQDQVTVEKATELAAYVVEEVKKIDPNCGGNTQIVTLDKGGIRKLTPQEVKKIVQNVTEIDECSHNIWWAIANKQKSCRDITNFLK
jgi:20S proteasome alpha/beta subunit